MERENINEKRNFLKEISDLAEKVKELPENDRQEAFILINRAQVAIENIQDFSDSVGGTQYESVCEKIFNDTVSNIEKRKVNESEGEDYSDRIAA